MKREFIKVFLFVLFIYAAIALSIQVKGGPNTTTLLGLLGISMGGFAFIIGVLLCFFKSTIKIGQAFIMSAGLLILIGFGFCSKQF